MSCACRDQEAAAWGAFVAASQPEEARAVAVEQRAWDELRRRRVAYRNVALRRELDGLAGFPLALGESEAAPLLNRSQPDVDGARARLNLFARLGARR